MLVKFKVWIRGEVSEVPWVGAGAGTENGAVAGPPLLMFFPSRVHGSPPIKTQYEYAERENNIIRRVSSNL